jgi:hypothetical protein
MNNAINVNIDDVRFFGNYDLDNEFSTLENAAFPQILLNAYDTQGDEAMQKPQAPMQRRQSKSLSITSSQKWGDESLDASNYDMTFGFRSDSSLAQQSPSQSRKSSLGDKNVLSETNLVGSASHLRSRVSDVEMMRGGTHRTSSLARSSISISMDEENLSTNKQSFHRDSALSTAIRFEDDIPAFDDQEVARSRHYDSLGAFDAQELFGQEAGAIARQDLMSFEEPVVPEQQDPDQAPEVEKEAEEVASRRTERVAEAAVVEAAEEQVPSAAPAAKRKQAKRPVVEVLY